MCRCFWRNQTSVEPQPFRVNFLRDEFDLVVLMTDGAESVQAEGKDRAEMLAAVVHELTAFKNCTGSFVQRRLQRAVKYFKSEGWLLGDDLTVAAISLD